MNFAVLVTQLPASTREHEQLISFGESLLPLPEGVFQPAPNVWLAARAGAEEFVHAAKVSAASHGLAIKSYSSDIGRVLVS